MGANGSSDQKTAENLKRVLSVNAKINSTLDLDELLGIIMTTAAEVMRSETASLMLIDEQTSELVFRVALGETGRQLVEKFRLKMGEGIAGHVAMTGEPLVINDPRSDSRFARRFDDATGFTTRGILCVPMRSRDKIIGVIQAINPVERDGFRPDEVELFSAFADQAALSVENARLHAALVRQEKAKQELRIAHEIQQNLLPDLSPGRFPADIAACSLPALEVGGDFYDVLKISDHETAFVIGDVSGKGVPAALYMVRAITEYRFLATRFSDPAALLQRLNDTLAENPSFGMFVTLTYAVLDHRAETLTYASAGHHPGIHFAASSGTCTMMPDAGGIPLGLSPGVSYTRTSIPLKKGDAALFYTDGVTEARSKSGEEYGKERLEMLVQNSGKLTASELTGKLIEELNRFSAGMPRHDDTTVLAVKI